MKKRVLVAWVVFVMGGAAFAQMVFLKGVDTGTLTTGDLLDGADNTGITTNVVEIPGLEITARSGATNQDINVTSGSMGITIFDSGDDTDALEEGEKLILSFSKEIRINRLDFNQFSTGESITVVVDGDAAEIHDLALTHRGSDYLDTNWVVSAYAEIEFFTTGNSTVGLDGIDITVLGASSEPTLSLVSSNGATSVSAAFDEANSTGYILQYRSDLADSNGWNTVSETFTSNAIWIIETTNHAGFFRIEEALQ